jgi:glucokinase
MCNSIFLCIDVGGTKLDYSFVEYGLAGRTCLSDGRLFCAEFTAFQDIFLELLSKSPGNVSGVCIAAAGPVRNNSISFTNLDWHIDADSLRKNSGFKQFILVNDLTAVMWGLTDLAEDEYRTIRSGDPYGDTRVVVAPGTGLGVGIGVETASGLVCLPSEGGHVSFSPRTELERDLLSFLEQETEHVSAELVCSGIGLGTLFRYLTRNNPCPAQLDYQVLGPWLWQQITEDGEYSHVARQTYTLFFDLLAEVCGNIAVTCLPGAGIYLAGGLMAKLSSFMDRERFIQRFLNRSVQQELLTAMSVYQVTHKNPALLGCEKLLAANL